MRMKGRKKKTEAVEKDRLRHVQRRFSVIMYLVNFAALFYPWMVIGDKRYHFLSFAIFWKKEGTASVLDTAGVPYDPSYSGGFGICLVLLLAYAVLSVFYFVTVLIRKSWNINYAVLFVCVVFECACREDYMPGRICGNVMEAILFPAVFLAVTLFECVGCKMIEIWDDTLRATLAYREKERREKAERKRRLAFPGKYSRLFYEVIWKNFRKNLKDYAMLFVCNALVFMVVLSGFGLHSVVREGDVSLQVGYPVGAGKLLLESLLKLGAVGLFMLVLLLLYYLKRRIPEYGMFSTLGIRRRTMYTCMGAELLIGGGLSLFVGGILGGILVEVVRRRLGNDGGWLSLPVILESAGVIALFYLVTFFVTHDLFVGFRMGNSTDLGAVGEKLPKKHLAFFTILGAVICIFNLRDYGENIGFENIDILIVSFLGIYLMLRYGMARYLKGQRKGGKYLGKIFKQHCFYHKSRSAAWYIFGLCVMQSCILGLFSVQLYATSLVKDADALSPYELVCLAGDGDEAFIQGLREREGTRAEVYPMVRVIGDRGEQPGRLVTPGVYSQNIGISESTYHELKKIQDPQYKKKDLGFDENGAGIYIVHQQDKSTKARPIDYKMMLYVGTVYFYSTGFDEWGDNELSEAYQITGEETCALTGIMCQGERENLVVFSDTYFEKVRESVLAMEYTGPTELLLVNTDEKTLEEIEPELKAFQERHKIDEKYDAKVKSYYLKEDAQKRFCAELNMKKVMAELLIPMFFLASVLLIKIKIMTEHRENRKRTEFLNCMGMKKKERIAIVRWEMRIYYMIVMLISGAAGAGIVWGTFSARFYEEPDIVFMLGKIIPFAVCEAAELGLILAFMTECEIRRLSI